MTVYPNVKLNLGLRVLGKRPDGQGEGQPQGAYSAPQPAAPAYSQPAAPVAPAAPVQPAAPAYGTAPGAGPIPAAEPTDDLPF